ncbi:MAG: hypothetical protein J7K22_03090 [Nanoarchaeota archaeon]|nr:hypothetical protein [Nanoarchaeota archaeon]
MPEYTTNFKGKEIRTQLTQIMDLEIEVNNIKTPVRVKYELGTWEDEKEVEFILPGLELSTGIGMIARFGKRAGESYREVKGFNQYYHDSELESFFTEKIFPKVKDELPDYMIELVNQRG